MESFSEGFKNAISNDRWQEANRRESTKQSPPYTILNAITLKTETGEVRVLQLRNPYSQSTYNGKFSNSSK